MMEHIQLPHKCHICSNILWFDEKENKNYIYKKGNYLCKGCVELKLNIRNIRS